MTTPEIILNLGLLAFVALTQWGARGVNRHRYLLPLALVAGAAYYFLPEMPTAGNDTTLEVAGVAAGVLFGLIAAAFITMTRDTVSGRIVATAGMAYMAVWTVVIGGRMLFAWWATNSGSEQIGRFSMEHSITGSAAWTCAFVLMALAMVCTRLAVMAVRTAYLTRRASPTTVAPSVVR